MSSANALTGHLGKAVVGSILITKLTMWRISDTVGESAWGDSESAGYTNRAAARRDATGAIGGKFDTTKKPYNVFRAGDIVTLVLWQTTTAGDYWAFPRVLIQSFDLEINPDTKEVVGWTSNWGSDGIFYSPGMAGAPSHSLPSS